MPQGCVCMGATVAVAPIKFEVEGHMSTLKMQYLLSLESFTHTDKIP